MKVFCKMNEAYWLIGNMLCAIGVALCTKAGFGLSMIAAPPFILNQFLSPISPFFSQGNCEYIFQAVLLLLMCIITRKFKWKYLLSFATAFIFGKMVDASLALFGGQALYDGIIMRIIAFILGEVIISFAVACYFRTNLPLCVYELFVVAVSEKFNIPSHKVKLFFDFSMLVLSVISTLLLFGRFVGVGIGTVAVTILNSPLINLAGRVLDKLFDNQPLFPKLIKAIK